MQAIHRAMPAMDVAHFLVISVNPTLRDGHMDEFLEAYYDALAGRLSRFGWLDVYSRECFRRDVKRCLAWGVIAGTMHSLVRSRVCLSFIIHSVI
jgi:hypothetical protein